MEIRVYTSNTCAFCEKVKNALKESEIDYVEVDINAEENKKEWLTVTRMTTANVTPQIKLAGDHWLPHRDFTTPEDLIKRIQFIEEYNLNEMSTEELAIQTQQMLRNLSFGMNGLRQDLLRIQNVLFNPKNKEDKNNTTPTKE
tara:strand:+ start:686 stop:1114 length:429 start_codon:yes stop_codon:yes gene_type:complete